MNWYIGEGPSDADPENNALTLFLEVDEFDEETDILYERFGFAKHEDAKAYSVDLEAILAESYRCQNLEATVTGLVAALGDIKERLAQQDAERLTAEMARQPEEPESAAAEEA